jgi:hypothetical protein
MINTRTASSNTTKNTTTSTKAKRKGMINTRTASSNTTNTHFIFVTVHRNRFIFNNQPDALIIQIYSTCFGQLLCPSSGVFYCTIGTAQFRPDSPWKRSSKNLHENYHCRLYSNLKREVPMPQAGFEPQSQQASGRRPTPLIERSLGSAFHSGIGEFKSI